MFFDDLAVGFTFETPAHLFTQDDIIAYAQVYDPQPFHIDPEAAARSIYGGIIASGLQTCAMAFALTLRANVLNESSMGSPGMDRIRWLKPVRPGDEIRVFATVVAATPSTSRPDRGRVQIDYSVRNQMEEIVLTYTITHLQRRQTAK